MMISVGTVSFLYVPFVPRLIHPGMLGDSYMVPHVWPVWLWIETIQDPWNPWAKNGCSSPEHFAKNVPRNGGGLPQIMVIFIVMSYFSGENHENIEISRASKYANLLVFPIFRQSQVVDTARRLSHKAFRQSKVYPDQISQFLKWKGSPSLMIHWFIKNHMWWGNKNLHISWLSISIHI